VAGQALSLHPQTFCLRSSFPLSTSLVSSTPFDISAQSVLLCLYEALCSIHIKRFRTPPPHHATPNESSTKVSPAGIRSPKVPPAALAARRSSKTPRSYHNFTTTYNLLSVTSTRSISTGFLLLITWVRR
jgi:hypothetical protein